MLRLKPYALPTRSSLMRTSNKMAAFFETIAAISTPPGKGGVALIRMSGDRADKIAERVFLPVSGKVYSDIAPRVATYGYIIEDGERLDDVLLTRFPAPASYTGEDVVEICCHGGILVTSCVLEALIRAGARYAEAGEFTKRAFISGKLSLTEAEAIGSLLDAESKEQIRLSSEPARKALEGKISLIRGRLVGIMSSVYARIDYPDEDLGEYSDEELLSALSEVREELYRLGSTYRTGKAIAEGITTAIIGKPNAGKSSLYNLLVGEAAAIVTDIKGTTRDVLERSVSLGRVMLRLYDTAGIRDEALADVIERIGIEKSREILEKCELIFALFDNSRPLDEDDRRVISEISVAHGKKIAIVNKCDLERKIDIDAVRGAFGDVLEVSTLDEEATVTALCKIVNSYFTDGEIKSGVDPIIYSARQNAKIKSAIDYLDEAISALKLGFSQDAVSGSVERTVGAVGELDGRQVNEEIVSDIFAKFCVGK